MNHNDNPSLDSTSTTSNSTPPKRKYYIERNIEDLDDARAIEKLDSKQKALHFNRTMSVLMNWPNWEIWPFKIAIPLIGFTAATSGYVLNSAFRGALLLGHVGKHSSYFATMGIPGAVGGLLHHLLIQNDILEQRTRCYTCVQVKSVAIQLGIGFIYPAFLAPLVSFPIASGMKNLYFPKFHKQPREVLSFAKDVFISVKNRYLAIGALQIVVAMGITHFQQSCYLNTLYPVLTGERKVTKRESYISSKTEFDDNDK